ncbi:MAG: phosphotransferase [Polyangiales bacterium]
MSSQALTPEALAARSARAVDIAARTGRELGLDVRDPKQLHDAFSVVVDLAPAPVVARMPVVLPPSFSREDELQRQQRELDAVAWLDHSGLPVVRPSPLVPRVPVLRDGLSMTFWEKVEVSREGEPDYVAQAALVVELHAALSGYTAPLPFLSPVMISIPQGLAALAQQPALIDAADLARAEHEWRVLGPVLSSREGFLARFPHAQIQPVHGDAPSYNLIRTPNGPVHADFEDVTLGPREWDLAGFGPESQASYNAAAARAGRPLLDPQVQQVMDCARLLQTVACLALVPQLPLLASGLAPSLEMWRASPLAGGLG